MAAAVLASAISGLFAPGFYHLVNPLLLPGTYGQDWMSLAAAPALVWAARSGRRGSLQGLMVWLGLLAYCEYAYALYAFGPQYTAAYPLYVVIVSLSAFALLLVSCSLDSSMFYRRLHDHLPTRSIMALFGAIVVALAPAWTAMMLAAIRAGKPSVFSTIHVLDLAFVFPTLVVAVIGVQRRRPWGYVLAGPMLVLAATMMGSLVVSEIIAAVSFTPDPWPLVAAFSLIALGAAVLSWRYLHLLGDAERRAR